MTNASKRIIEDLKAKGYRLTAAREEIISTLAKSKQSFSIKALVKKVDADETSVYRTIDTLKKEGLVSEIKIIGEKDQYELAHGHHHHLVCSGCGLVEHIPCTPVSTPKLPKNFRTVDAHEVTFYGRCLKCV